MEATISLPDGARVPATPGTYRVVPPPDLNTVVSEDSLFLLEYDFPLLLVRDRATSQACEDEKGNAIAQVEQWKIAHYGAGGRVGYDRTGYQFPSPPCSGYRHQFIPTISYVDPPTWALLSPAVVIELMSASDNLQALQVKVARFISAGCREGVIVDTQQNRVWIYNHNQPPYFDVLAPVEFDAWPGFTLDCVAIRDARLRGV